MATDFELFSFDKTFTQDGDTCSSREIQGIVISQIDGGGGAYWYFKSERWAFSDIEEVVELLEKAGCAHRADVAKEPAE